MSWERRNCHELTKSFKTPAKVGRTFSFTSNSSFQLPHERKPLSHSTSSSMDHHHVYDKEKHDPLGASPAGVDEFIPELDGETGTSESNEYPNHEKEQEEEQERHQRLGDVAFALDFETVSKPVQSDVSSSHKSDQDSSNLSWTRSYKTASSDRWKTDASVPTSTAKRHHFFPKKERHPPHERTWSWRDRTRSSKSYSDYASFSSSSNTNNHKGLKNATSSAPPTNGHTESISHNGSGRRERHEPEQATPSSFATDSCNKRTNHCSQEDATVLSSYSRPSFSHSLSSRHERRWKQRSYVSETARSDSSTFKSRTRSGRVRNTSVDSHTDMKDQRPRDSWRRRRSASSQQPFTDEKVNDRETVNVKSMQTNQLRTSSSPAVFGVSNTTIKGARVGPPKAMNKSEGVPEWRRNAQRRSVNWKSELCLGFLGTMGTY